MARWSTTLLAIVAAAPFAIATSGDETVTETLTRTHYTCPCDSASPELATSSGWGEWASLTGYSSSPTSLWTTSSSSTPSHDTTISTPDHGTTVSTPYQNTTTSKPTAPISGCPYATCVSATDLPTTVLPSISSLCSSLLSTVTATPVTVTTTVTTNVTGTVTPDPTSIISSFTVTLTATAALSCSTTVTVTSTPTTVIGYRVLGQGLAAGRRSLSERAAALPDFITGVCADLPSDQQLADACSCILSVPTVTPTVTATVTASIFQTATLPAVTQTVSTTITETATVSVCLSTTTSSVTVVPPFACGTSASTLPTASTSGSLTCANTVPTPSSNARHRIEGSESEGTIFEDCVVAGPRSITTPSGGTHSCDGTNNNANSSPGTTITDQLDAASKLMGFPYDGTYDSRFQDFFISSISASTQTGNSFWGVLNNQVFTTAGGCQVEVAQIDRSLWAYDVFNKNALLSVSPDYAVATSGSGTVTVQVLAVNPNSGNSSPASAGVTIAGVTPDANGNAVIPIPSQPGCYQYKAAGSGFLRSNAFYLSVYDSFSAA